MGPHKNSFANRVRVAAQELGAGGKSFTVTDLSIKAKVKNRKEEKRMTSTMQDFIKAGEARRISTGVYIYVGKTPKGLPLKDQMKNLLRIKGFVTVEELRELGAAEAYAVEWLSMLVRRGVAVQHSNGRYELIANMVIPENDDKAARLRELRAKKKALVELLDAISDSVGKLRDEVRDL